MTKLNEDANVGPTFVFIFAIIMIVLSWFLFTPLMDVINDAQTTQITNGDPVSPERISTMNTINQLWDEAIIVILLIMVGIWYWVVSIRERSGGL